MDGASQDLRVIHGEEKANITRKSAKPETLDLLRLLGELLRRQSFGSDGDDQPARKSDCRQDRPQSSVLNTPSLCVAQPPVHKRVSPQRGK